jgi:hypothetical protein
MDEDFNYFDMQIIYNNVQWRATGVYGYPQSHNKLLTCNLLNELAGNQFSQKWLLFGDFNIITCQEEKMGGNTIDYNIIDLFRNTLNNCALQDLGYTGEIFTWTNRQEENQHIKARLDRFLANDEWMASFPRHQNSHLVRYGSDHYPMLLDFSDFPAGTHNQHQQKIKKYEIVWTRHKDHHLIVKKAWQQAHGNTNKKLATTLHNLHIWGSNEFGIIPKRIKATQLELQELNLNSDKSNMMNQIHSKEKELDNLLESEEMWWS